MSYSSLSVAFVCSVFAATRVDGAQAPAAPIMAQVIERTTAADWRALDPEHTLYLTLPAGRVVIELAPAVAPLHVQNIKALVREGYFDGLAVIRSQDNYVAQWGEATHEDPARARPVRTAKRTLAPEFTLPLTKDFPFTVLPDGDGYAPEVGFSNGFWAARDPARGRAWLCHCYGMVGVARREAADSGGGTSLYAVNGHAPRHLDRNVTLVGRVVHGMELLSTLPRGTGTLGFYETTAERVPIVSMRVAADVPQDERLALEVMRTDTPSFAALVESRRNRSDAWYKVPAGFVELCNVPIPVRRKPGP